MGVLVYGSSKLLKGTRVEYVEDAFGVRPDGKEVAQVVALLGVQPETGVHSGGDSQQQQEE